MEANLPRCVLVTLAGRNNFAHLGTREVVYQSPCHVVKSLYCPRTEIVVVPRSQLLGRRRVDHCPNASDLVGREPSLLGVSPYGVLVRRDVNTVDLVIGDVALEPLDLRAYVLKDPARFLRNRLELLSGQLPGIGDLTLDHELRQGFPLWGSTAFYSFPPNGAAEAAAPMRR